MMPTEPSCKVDVPNPVSDLKRDLYLSGVWLGVNLRMDTKKATSCLKKRLDCVLKNC